MKSRTKKKAKTRRVSKRAESRQISDLRLLEMLINKFIEKLEKNGFVPKVQDALRAIRLKQKLAQTCEAEKIFWELIDQLRKEELNRTPAKPSRSGSNRKNIDE